MTGRSFRVLCLWLAVTAAFAWAPRAAPAQDVSSLQGTFAWDSAASGDVTAAVDAAIADLGFLHRRFARGHLEQANRPYRTVTIEQDEATVSIATDGGEPIRAPASGEPIDWTRGDGKRMRVSIVREEDTIRQTFVGEGEQRENLFRPSDNGRNLILTVTTRMARLPEPIRYELVYRRSEHGRMGQYLRGMAGPGPLLGTLLSAGVGQLLDEPEEWDRDLAGYGRRVASRWGRLAVQTTVTHGLAAALDRPTDYSPCGYCARGKRVGHALLGAVTDPGPDGGRTLALPRIAGAYAGAFARLAWDPGDLRAGDALESGTLWIMGSAIGNLLQEFLGAKIPLKEAPGIFDH